MSNVDKLHASGHANGAQVIDTLKKIGPKTVIPIHTEKPDYLKSEFNNVWTPEYGATYSF